MSISSPVCSENNVGCRGSSVSSRKTTCTDERTTAIAVPLPHPPILPDAKILLIYLRVLSEVTRSSQSYAYSSLIVRHYIIRTEVELQHPSEFVELHHELFSRSLE